MPTGRADLRSWLAPPGPEQLSEADRLSDATIAACGADR